MPRIRSHRWLAAGLAAAGLALAVPASAVAAPAAVTPAAAVGDVQLTGTQRLASGVTLATFQATASHGTVTGELITADLADPHVSVRLLRPDAVAQRETVSGMTADAHAVAGVNADYFNIDESQHPGVAATGSSDGPEVDGGRAIKAAVPDKQRFGPAMAPGTSTRDVIGVGVDGRARLGTLTLAGSIVTPGHRYALAGLNQYAVAEGGIDAFTSAWGATSRERAVCGSDTRRGDPCSTDTAEVTIRHGRVTAVADAPGAGAIPAGSTVLVGREAGADTLRGLHVGEPVHVSYRLTGAQVPFRVAVGGAPIMRDGATITGVDDKVAATRTGAGISADGRTLYLMTTDGLAESGSGLTLAEEADLLAGFGAADGMNLDGGGSTTCAARLPGSDEVTLVNKLPTGAAERPVANGLGIVAR
ncbi:phosphodiester glycosidase family protein [Actinocatenispora sera]|uniref:Phosphodiester glycosidase domain-containing protein n=1 Tax=Actinocatenispora sera TaxID=390989 RepID=A0A810L922_9ACTN|nr:phosphodiester glycosidase family protein [Actinocatenispora sera]BCJ31375.1 hypothetical protein Asera_54830 [Actinocatenispora sera]